jgi:hypothetical protein
MTPQDFFEDVIYAYTDQMALDDGVLIDISSLGLVFEGKPVNRMTATLFWELKPLYPLSEEDIQKFVVEDEDDESEPINFDMKALKQDLERRLTEFVGTSRIRELIDPMIGNVWIVENEIYGWTLMYPSGY